MIRDEKNGAYLLLITKIIQENLYDTIEDNSKVFKYQKQLIELFSLYSSISEIEKVALGNEYPRMVELFIAFFINILPGADLNTLLIISRSIGPFVMDNPDKLSVNVCKRQIVELIAKNVELMVEQKVFLGYSNVLLQILVNLSPIYQPTNDEVENEVSVLYDNVLKVFFNKLKANSEDVLLLNKANLALLNSLLKRDGVLSATALNELLSGIIGIDLKSSQDLTVQFTLDYLLCVSLVNDADQLLRTNTVQSNILRCVDYFLNNLEIKKLTEELLVFILEIYKNLSNTDQYRNISESGSSKLETIHKSLLRYIADHFNEFSIPSFELIIKSCLETEVLEIDIDDGSGLYTKFLIQEVYEHMVNHLKRFSPDFQIQIQPLLEKYKSESILESSIENIKNNFL